MTIKKKISLGLITTIAIATPIVAVTSCKTPMAKGNQEINRSFDYTRDGISHFNNFKTNINEQWNNDLGKKFIITITNKSKQKKIFIMEKGEGRGSVYKEGIFITIENFLNK